LFAHTERAIRAGLIVAAEAYLADVRPQLQEGYKSGDFVTGNAANSANRGEPELTGGGWEIWMGSTQTDPPYPLMWEVGHHNVFTGQFERKEIWVPTLVENRDKYVQIQVDEIRAVDGAL
jgi:hypothetical protein